MSPINKIPKLKVSEEVLRQMKDLIISGEWPLGRKIPGEMELVSLFGVSRISIRQAIHQLVGMGILVVKSSEGTFVNENIPVQYFNIFLPYLMIEKPNIIEVFEYRCIIEGKAAALATERATAEDIKLLETTYKNLEKCKDDYDEFVKYDVLFHNIIASATKNSVIIKIMSILYDLIQSTMREATELLGVEKGLRYHLKILEAIKKRDKALAEDIMGKHVGSSLESLKKRFGR
ncbi:putative L-lactate dehydrogenase operon regulatory protein [subsurface metagenome]|nr:FCD domain-containing protein [Clostridia bacterium]